MDDHLDSERCEGCYSGEYARVRVRGLYPRGRSRHAWDESHERMDRLRHQPREEEEEQQQAGGEQPHDGAIEDGRDEETLVGSDA